MYTYYVMILGISENIFWNADFSFLMSIIVNKLSYENFIQYQRYKLMNQS
jgi:hypothetical protein